jgi:methyl-accepting chemotaxis protein
LFFAFVAALVFQLVQLLVTDHYIGHMTTAAERLDHAVTASEAANAALETTAAAGKALREAAGAENPSEHLQVARVYLEEVWRQTGAMAVAAAELEGMSSLVERFAAVRAEVNAEIDQALAAANKKDEDGVEEHASFADDALAGIVQTLSQTGVKLRAEIQAATQSGRSVRDLPAQVGFTVFGVAALLLLSYAAVFSRRFVRPIVAVAETVRGIAEHKDLTVVLPVTRNDELGSVAKAINMLAEEFREALEAVNTSARDMEQQSHTLRKTSDVIAKSAVGQASSISELSRSLDSISGQMNSTVEGTSSARNLAVQSREKTASSWERMQELSKAMEEIGQASSEAEKVSTVIDEIAFQTNLLALNAAIEAARAGEAGKGFAVVAEEVRSLAQRSAESAKNSGAIIARSREGALRGAEVAKSLAEMLKDVMGAVEQVDGHLASISSSAGHQAEELHRINGNLANVDVSIQSGAASAEELAATASQSSEHSGHLRQMVERFKIEHPAPAGHD